MQKERWYKLLSKFEAMEKDIKANVGKQHLYVKVVGD